MLLTASFLGISKSTPASLKFKPLNLNEPVTNTRYLHFMLKNERACYSAVTYESSQEFHN